jgi:ABC-type Fe3+/spermidine/putrescine transport system ATPase subunit
MPFLSLKGLSKSFGAVVAVHPLDLDVAAGDFCAILGPSGCGKSTLLRMIAGFAEPSSGSVIVDGADVTAWGPEKRPTNMVFQGYGLFPHLTVVQNIAFGLKLRRLPADAIRRQVSEALRLVRLDGFEGRTIDRLSGGQQQRVAVARALVMKPKVLLLDEPLAALDLKLRHAMQEELRRIHREIGGTFIFVTHDQGEAFALANRVVVMNAGRVEQIGAPDEIYLDPRTLFVADFVGEATMLRGRRTAGGITLAAGPAFSSPGRDGDVRVMIRPNRVVVDPPAGHIVVDARVRETVFLGDTVKVSAALASGEMLVLRDHESSRRGRYVVGASCRFGWAARDQRVIEEGAGDAAP